jgi:hypothetical protein
MTWLLATALCWLLPGCQADGPEADLEDYLTRLGRALSVAPATVNEPRVPPPPRPGELRQTLRSRALDGLDFLALTGCAVQVTIGKRNSSLGRMAADSQKLMLDLEYLRLAPDCIVFLRSEGRTALADRLESAWELKRDQLPTAIYNATLAGREYRQFWRAVLTPGDYPAATGSQVISAMAAINGMTRRWLSGDHGADNQAFEIYLGEVATGDGGALIKALGRQQAWLQAADSMLHARRQRGALCAPGTRHDAADILPNVVRRGFVARVQPHSAALARRYHELVPPVSELETLLELALPADFIRWKNRRNSLLQTWMDAPRRHVQQLQATLEPCGGIRAPT